MTLGSSSVSTWTDEENKKFELALVEAMKSFDFDTPDYWNYVAREVGGVKSVEDIKEQFAKLEKDVKKIDDGQVPIPNYKPLSDSSGKGKDISNDHEQK